MAITTLQHSQTISMHTWTIITFVALATTAIYLLALGTDWLLENRFRKVLFLLRRKESFERHASRVQECILTFQFLENILLLQPAEGVRRNIEAEVTQRWDSIADVLRSFQSDPALLELCICLEEYKKQQQAFFDVAFSSNCGSMNQVQTNSASTDAHRIIKLLAVVARQKTHETFHAVCTQFSPFFWPLACIPLVVITYLGIALIKSLQ